MPRSLPDSPPCSPAPGGEWLPIQLRINQIIHHLQVDARTTLLDLLREQLGQRNERPRHQGRFMLIRRGSPSARQGAKGSAPQSALPGCSPKWPS